MEKDPVFFSLRPCLIHQDSTGNLNVYAGNQRVKAAKKLGWNLVPCIVEIDVSEQLIKERIISDNVTMGEFDWDILSANYDVDELLDCGLTAKDLHLDLSLDDQEETAASKEKEPKKCPHCGLDI